MGRAVRIGEEKNQCSGNNKSCYNKMPIIMTIIMTTIMTIMMTITTTIMTTIMTII